MKKIFLYGTLFFATWTLFSCQKEDEAGDGDGYVSLSIKLPTVETRSSVTPDLFDPFALRIYKTDGAKELIRHYHSYESVPEKLWLKNGNYLVSVALGDSTVQKPTDRVKTALNKCCFSGEQAFEIKTGETTEVEIKCDPKETIVEVNFDKTVDDAFDMGYRVCAMISESFNQDDTINGAVPFYTFLQNGQKRVYFLVPDDDNTLSYCFWGKRSNGEDIHEHYTLAFDPDKKAGYRYLLSFKYSKDAEGVLQFTVEVDRSRTEISEYIGIIPDAAPTVTGNGIDGAAYTYTGGNAVAEYTLSTSGKTEIKSVTISTAAPVATRAVSADNQITVSVDNPTEHQDKGITLDVSNKQAVVLKLAQTFFNQYVPGGESTMNISARDNADQDGVVEVHLKSSGATSLASLGTPQDKWAGKGEIKGAVYAAASTVKVQYREKETQDWQQSDATLTDGNTYTAQVTGITAGHTYEYQLLIDGTPTGTVQTTAITGGWQIPNGGFETWEQIGNPWCPYTQNGEQWWDTGNHGSTSLGASYNVTTRDTGKKGYAAKLASRNVLVKFAAGNIFVGKYIDTDGTNGVIGFGKPFTPEYRPKKVTFWYKGTVGSINCGSGAPGVSSGNPDVAQFYVMLCSNMTGPHIVATKDTETFMNFETSTIDYCPNRSLDKNSRNTAKDGHIVAKAVWENSQSESDWKKVELTLNYTEYAEEIPTYILITASASKYGDYFMGSDNSVMYIDEVTFEY